jgi:hypothetical protein
LKRDEAIRIIQEERKAKEEAENAKYSAVKRALEDEEKALDGFAERYKEKLDAQLAEKIRTEDEKLTATKDRVNDEIEEVNRIKAAEIEAIDATMKKRKEEALEREKSFQASILYTFLTGGYKEGGRLSEMINIPGLQQLFQISEFIGDYISEGTKELLDFLIPGRAVGDANWRGGLARVHEKGGEIMNLPQGTQIIPHDVSMQLAKSIGEAVGSAQGGVINVNLFVDGKVLASVMAPYQQQNQRSRSLGQGVG